VSPRGNPALGAASPWSHGDYSPPSTCATAIASAVADADSIRRFVPSVIEAIGMRAHGPLALERFGEGELDGWSALQSIETSSITIHADEVGDRCFVDIFSCRRFVPDLAAAIAVEHFGGTATVTVLER
jgi:S-adenosylmethionine decarboxylase